MGEPLTLLPLGAPLPTLVRRGTMEERVQALKTEPPEEEERTGLGVAARTPQGEVVTDLQLPGGTEVQDTLVVFLGRLLNVRVGGAVEGLPHPERQQEAVGEGGKLHLDKRAGPMGLRTPEVEAEGLVLQT